MTLLDVRRCIPERPLQTDLCIVGAGAAGIALAREFIGTGTSVIILESGGLRYSRRVQRLAAGDNIGLPSYALTHSRFRAFGGSTIRWPAQCRPLDRIDFQSRPASRTAAGRSTTTIFGRGTRAPRWSARSRG